MKVRKSALFILIVLLMGAIEAFGGGSREESFSQEAGGDPAAPVTTEEPGNVGNGASGSVESGGGENGDSPDSAEENAPIGEETRRLIEASSLRGFKERVPSVDFSLPALDGGEVSLSDHRGSVVILNFWATWCPPCREELPSMVRLQNELRDEPFTILAVSVREQPETVLSFLEETGFELPVLLDESGNTGVEYGVRGIPTSYVVDTGGRVLAMLVGAREWDDPEVVALMRHLAEE